MANQYDVGRVIRVTGTYTTSTGAAFDPDDVRFSVKQPNGTLSTYVYSSDPEVVKSSVGVYYVDVVTTLPGTWYHRWFSSGNQKTATQGFFTVRKVEAQ